MVQSNKIPDFLKKFNLLIILLGFIVISMFLSSDFFTISNFMNLLQQCSITGVVAVGMTFVILIGGIDLSVGSLAAFAGMMVGMLLQSGQNIVVAIVVAVLFGAVIGSISGFLTTKFNIPSFIVTLAMMVTVRGLALFSTNGKVLTNLPEAFTLIGNYKIFNTVPVSGLIWITISLIAVFILKYTLFGRGVYAIGGNKEAALLSGIRIKLYSISTFIISGALAAVSGVMLTSWLTVAQPTISQGQELNAIAAVVLGGTSLSGGSGGVVGTLGGVFLMQVITNIFNLTGVSSYYQQIFMGVIIILALLMNSVLIPKEK